MLVEVEPLVGYDKAALELCHGLELVGARRLGDDVLTLAAAVAGIDLAGHSSSPSVPLDPAMAGLAASVAEARCAIAGLLDTARNH